VVECARCGHGNPDGARFCNACAAPLAGAAPTRREERKVVSVLFADLVGFTARAEQLDPEDVRALLAPYHDRLRVELERFGGTVEKFIGDAVMALFGAPAAHEDDPERAVRAALAIRDSLAGDERGLQLRIGVNTGEALVSVDARTADGEAMAAGDVVNTAARIQTAAPVNTVLVGERTYRATRHAVEYRAAAAIVAKGKAEPVAVWEAVRPVAHGGADAEWDTPLVGRRRELELLESLLDRVCEDRTAQLVTLVGVPGIGKSRLVGELASHAGRRSESITWRRGRSLPYGEGVTFWALGEIVKAEAGILESDAAAAALDKLRRAVGAIAESDAEAAWLTARLSSIVGVEDGAGQRSHDDRLPAWRRFLEALAEERPLVAVFEDVHWADDDLLAFVDELADRIADVPLLIVATARPELLERRPGWGGGKPNSVTMSLAPLRDDDCAELVEHLLSGAVPGDGQDGELLRRIGGNPLYAEQYARALAERGDALSLPDTIHGVIAARLDALRPDDKRALQAAAVIGTVFWGGAVGAISGIEDAALAQAFQRLERTQFIHRARRSSIADEVEHAFRHALLRDVAYEQIPRSERSGRHLAAAEWLEAMARPDELAQMLAHHYDAALRYAPPGSVDPALHRRARAAFMEAGERALSLAGYQSAAGFFVAARELGSSGAGDDARVLLGLGRARFGADSSGADELEAAFEAATADGDRELAAEAALALRVHAWYRGDGDAAARWLEHALDLVGDRPDSRVKVHVLAEQSRSSMGEGDMAASGRYAREALELAERVGLGELRPRLLTNIGTSRVYLGDAGGLEDIRRAADAAREARLSEQVHGSLNNLSWGQLALGDLPGAVQTYEELMELMGTAGRDVDRRWAGVVMARLRMTEGRWDDALELAAAFIEESKAGTPHYLEPVCLTVRGMIATARDDLATATVDTERALTIARGADAQIVSTALLGRITVLLAAGDSKAAAQLLDELLDSGGSALTTLSANVVEVAWLARDLDRTPQFRAGIDSVVGNPWTRAATAVAQGDADGAVRLLDPLACRPATAYARLRAGQAAVAAGDHRAAEEHLAAAERIFGDLRATRHLREIDAARAELTVVRMPRP
jgi:class 3 adenylate cyclase/tetratricopeptide (TPR) repeat protein